ncbi:MAG: hypothetical protein ACFFDW_06190 [Candidatus Thorarchaeota archaeon]
MTYVPPEKKQQGSTSGFGDIVYVIMFYVIEIAFIFLGIPIVILSIGFIPIAMYLIITEGGQTDNNWIFYLFGVVIIFFQILGLQYFFRKWILQPNNMTFGEWLRWKFSPSEIKKRRYERIERSRRMDEWYSGMERVKEMNEKIKEEQAIDFRYEWYKETGSSDVLLSDEQSTDVFIIGEEQADEDSFSLEMESEKSAPEIPESEEITFIQLGGEENIGTDEEKN